MRIKDTSNRIVLIEYEIGFKREHIDYYGDQRKVAFNNAKIEAQRQPGKVMQVTRVETTIWDIKPKKLKQSAEGNQS